MRVRSGCKRTPRAQMKNLIRLACEVRRLLVSELRLAKQPALFKPSDREVQVGRSHGHPR